MLIRTAREVGLLIKDTRKAAGLTQAALAERVGASRQWVRLLELGKSPRIELGLTLRALTALGITVDARVQRDAHSSDAARPTLSDDEQASAGKLA
jgi:transcriptional regulator with XRE-family HTH domain